MPITPPPIVVAVGRHSSVTALEYAGLEALRQGCGLHVVHAVDVAQGERDGAVVLAAAVRRVQTLVPGLVRVTFALVLSSTVAAIVTAAEDAPLVVVGRCPEPRWTRPYVRSVTAGVAAAARAPVVSVLDGWECPSGSAQVVVGADDAENSAGILHEGFAAARARLARLTVVSTWWRPAGTDRQTFTQVDDVARAERFRAGIDRSLSDLREAYDDVAVEIQVRNERPVDVLVEESRDAVLLVLGRHDPFLPTGSHLGPVARSVLRSAACPVLLATSRPSHLVRGGDRHHAHLA
jgi:nucleotide-binding universal stress UspA family protein